MLPQNSLVPGTPLTILSEKTATAAIPAILLLKGQSQNITIVFQSTGTTSGGTLQIEEAYWPADANPYAGTWSALGSAVNASSFTGGAQAVTHLINYSVWALRVRIATEITGGGSATVIAWAT